MLLAGVANNVVQWAFRVFVAVAITGIATLFVRSVRESRAERRRWRTDPSHCPRCSGALPEGMTSCHCGWRP